MSEAPRKEIPLPKGDDDFEDLVLALFREVWQDPGAKLHDRAWLTKEDVLNTLPAERLLKTLGRVH